MAGGRSPTDHQRPGWSLDLRPGDLDMADHLSLQLGLETIESYKRPSSPPWHALAEFVDNSTQSFFNNRRAVADALAQAGDDFRIDVVYDRENLSIRVSDNAMGMNREELDRK